MATKQCEASAPVGDTGTCVEVAGTSGSTTLTVRCAGGEEVDLVLPVAPDAALAQRFVGGWRRVSWVSIDARGEGYRCEAAGLTRRPQRVRVPGCGAGAGRPST